MAGGSPGGAAGRAGAEAPRRRLAEVWPRQCEGFPPRRAGEEEAVPSRSRGRDPAAPRTALGSWWGQKLSGSTGCKETGVESPEVGGNAVLSTKGSRYMGFEPEPAREWGIPLASPLALTAALGIEEGIGIT